MVSIARKRLGLAAKCSRRSKRLFQAAPRSQVVSPAALGIAMSKGRSLKGLHSRRTPHDSNGACLAARKKTARLLASAASLYAGIGTNGSSAMKRQRHDTATRKKNA